MGRKKTHAEYENQLLEREIDYFPLEPYVNDRTPIIHQCINEHQWKVCPSNILTGQGCPYCYNARRFKSHEQYISEIKIDAEPIEPYQGVKTYLWHKCSENHKWKSRPDIILAGHGCPECWAASKSLTHEEYLARIKSDAKPIEKYINSNTKILHECSKGHVWDVQPRSILAGHGCPQCNLVGGYNSTRFAKDRELATSPGILYVIVLVNKATSERTCVKIGITRGSSNKDVLKRAAGFKGYEPRIQKLFMATLEEVYNLEQELHNKFSTHSYKSEWKFGGSSELFQIEKLKDILAELPKSV